MVQKVVTVVLSLNMSFFLYFSSWIMGKLERSNLILLKQYLPYFITSVIEQQKKKLFVFQLKIEATQCTRMETKALSDFVTL